MANGSEKRCVTIVTACMKRDGLPAFAINEVRVTAEEAENGLHVELVEGQLLADGYEEPFVHFPDDEAPPFLHGAVRRQLRHMPPVRQSRILSSETS